MIYRVLIFLFGIKVALVTCQYEDKKVGLDKEKYRIRKWGKLDKSISEASGLALNGEYLLWSINDSGGGAIIYETTREGVLKREIPIPQASNKDWEEICRDDNGNTYIGDFGNNNSTRKDLTIYKWDGSKTERIQFTYPDQIEGKKEHDCEAFFWTKDSLYLFTKSWESPAVKVCRLYVLSDQPGLQVAKKIDEIWLKAQITGAAIRPDKKQFALISYGKIFLFGIENQNINFQKPQQCIKIAKKQTEAISYDGLTRLIFTNEQRGIFAFDTDLILP